MNESTKVFKPGDDVCVTDNPPVGKWTKDKYRVEPRIGFMNEVVVLDDTGCAYDPNGNSPRFKRFTSLANADGSV